MKGARSVATAASLGNLLQGWDNAAIAGALLYLKTEFHLEENPTLEGMVVASTLIGAVVSTACAGPSSDALGRRTMLCVSAFLFVFAGSLMVWSPTIYVLIVGRFFVGTSIGLAATIVPILISESAPTEIRGQLATLPQLLGSSGLFLAYCMVFGFSLMAEPSWRMILGIILIPGALYLALCVCYLPESPRWLVSKGRMLEARHVLQNLRGAEHDVSAELALLVEGLGVGAQTQLEEWLLKPADKLDAPHPDEGQFTLFGEDTAWVAQPLKDESGLSLLSRRPSMDGHSMPFVDDMVSLMGSLQTAAENLPSDFSEHVESRRNSFWGGDEEQGQRVNGGYQSEDVDQGMVGDMDETLQTPLLKGQSKTNVLSRQGSKNLSRGNSMRLSRTSSRIDGMFGEVGSVGGIGGGWQLAWRTDGEDGRFERVFLLQEGHDTSRFNSHMSLPGIGGEDSIQAAALIGPSVQFSKELLNEHAVGPAMVHPSETATKGPAWSDLMDVGVKRALIVGVGLQVLQQFCGINAVLYFTPQILKQSGADAMAASAGINADSASIMASAFTCLMMLPCIFLAMWLMDKSGRRQLLLSTLPVLCVSLVCVILVNTLVAPGLFQAIGSFIGVATFICCFVMGFGPIPNIMCSEIFPTRVRGIAIGITSAAMWVSNVIVSYAFPIANAKYGLVGVFGFFATMSFVAWIFVFLKVPETKGLPLEIICEFFAMAGQQTEARKHHTEAEEPNGPTKRV
ncbi:protein MpTMT [Marchantia polymorpha subsp. ruderalis]|uniref:Major facilitator superfamily (MFS) profile domain-containing protein n=2 Tax=Marchantia polymorpha TaxID=3197 RepID=A0A176W0K9_MARPO|nr:tonoplast monosaccharide transporter [Marchantia polymorpha]OAE26604.1 hypothetical protein AXG93_4542s1250 [Marchantia polymorpha subsp. ruderalis]PTQ38179.1 hypothetical protein MARPO_0053s0102 [Marchantia polymorpha]BBN13977.1 hypothetical protein Mp_6g07890 [Marchantia polymorpha subsp. ruderalis]|eukprot:PTQ38179.1 hypothetical protein MARPO_0053s0102 [Marchantia polymorpha]